VEGCTRLMHTRHPHSLPVSRRTCNGNPLVDGHLTVSSCGGSIGRVERMGDHQKRGAIVWLEKGGIKNV
jgi:hypothetical protein